MPQLKLAPELVPPPARPPGAAADKPVAGAKPSAQVPGAPLKFTPIGAGGGAIFVRADEIDGTSEKFVEASGKVELRTRSETVLADWLRYDVEQDEIWGKGNVLLRKGPDWITGPELKFRRDTETGYFTSPRFYIAENGSRGDAAEIRFVAPDHYEVRDARYTTCVAPNEDWYIRTDQLEIDKSRMSARVMTRPCISSACRSRTRRGSSSLSPTSARAASSRRRSDRARCAASMRRCPITSTSRPTTT